MPDRTFRTKLGQQMTVLTRQPIFYGSWLPWQQTRPASKGGKFKELSCFTCYHKWINGKQALLLKNTRMQTHVFSISHQTCTPTQLTLLKSGDPTPFVMILGFFLADVPESDVPLSLLLPSPRGLLKPHGPGGVCSLLVTSTLEPFLA